MGGDVDQALSQEIGGKAGGPKQFRQKVCTRPTTKLPGSPPITASRPSAGDNLASASMALRAPAEHSLQDNLDYSSGRVIRGYQQGTYQGIPPCSSSPDKIKAFAKDEK